MTQEEKAKLVEGVFEDAMEDLEKFSPKVAFMVGTMLQNIGDLIVRVEELERR